VLFTLEATGAEQDWLLAWLPDLGIKQVRLDPGGGARALVLGGKAEAELDIEVQGGSLVVTFAAARQKIIGSVKVPPALWWPGIRAKIQAAPPLPGVTLRVQDEGRRLWVTVAGWEVVRVLILGERISIEVEPV